MDGSKFEASHTAVKAGPNAVIELTDSQLRGGDTAVSGDANPRISLQKNSLIKGSSFAITVGNNFVLTMNNSRIEANDTAFKGGYNGKIDATQSQIHLVSTTVLGAQNMKR